VVHGNHVYVTTKIVEGAEKSLWTLCFDRESGEELWRHNFGRGVKQTTRQKSNLAANTPTVTDDALYVAFGYFDITRYSHDGEMIWVNRYISKFGDPKEAWGYGLSPLVLNDLIFFRNRSR